jgi:XTP/dITP diphosphohydrolase
MKLVFATNNKHKVEEIKSILKGNIELLTLQDAGINREIPEPFDTLEDNARAKSTAIYELTGSDCFSEDTGLEVDALNGEPGVHSARYAGANSSADANIDKLLLNLQDKADRGARFRTVISLLIDGKETQFEGLCNGRILEGRQGNGGFGYDPVFIPNGSEKSFAEMSGKEKNYYSHRARAVEKLVAFLDDMALKE